MEEAEEHSTGSGSQLGFLKEAVVPKMSLILFHAVLGRPDASVIQTPFAPLGGIP